MLFNIDLFQQAFVAVHFFQHIINLCLANNSNIMLVPYLMGQLCNGICIVFFS